MGSAPRARALIALIALIVLLFAAGSAQPDEADDPVPLPSSGSKPKLATLRPHSDGTPPPRGGGAIGDAASSNGVKGEHPSARRRPHPIVLPSSGKEHTKLTLQKEGLDVLRGIKGPVAPVVVIGPYRSGKSFLLNQLLGVSCGEGFGVGHTRKTETKGVWVWGEPVTVSHGGKASDKVAIVYVDTEGFEATGMSDAYDDRIFALSSIVASVLIYNLPETVKEGDIEKLSFAVELAQEFYSRARRDRGGIVEVGSDGDEDEEDGDGDNSRLSGKGSALRETFLPNSLLWLIQRDFLEGSTVSEMVKGALKPVANPGKDKHVNELNRIRKSLSALAKNSTAFGLKQPHLQRTKLCELKDAELEPAYVKQREQLRALVRHEARAKPTAFLGGGEDVANGMGGGLMSGPVLAALIERSVKALNEGDFPSAGNVVDSFNRDAMERHLVAYEKALEAVHLPAVNEDLERAHDAAAYHALEGFRRDRFGRGAVTVASLKARMEELYTARREKNSFASGRECERLSSVCEEELVGLQVMRLPSRRKFDDALAACNATWQAHCVGPSRGTYAARLARSAARERAAFLQSYNARLLNGLLVAAIAGIVVFRFLIKSGLLELASWGLFVLLEVAPKLYIGPGESMFDSAWWAAAVKVWEMAVYNPLVDLDRAGPVIGGVVLAIVLWVRVRGCVAWFITCCPCLKGLCCCCTSALAVAPGWRNRKKIAVRDRDLDV